MLTRCHIIQRLDKGTSGAIVVATTGRAASLIGERLRKREFHKEYIGFCVGIPRGTSGYRYSGTLISNLDFDHAEKKQNPIT